MGEDPPGYSIKVDRLYVCMYVCMYIYVYMYV